MRAPVFDEESGFSQRAKTGSPHETEKSYVCPFSCNSDETRPDYHSGKRSALEPGRACGYEINNRNFTGLPPEEKKDCGAAGSKKDYQDASSGLRCRPLLSTLLLILALRDTLCRASALARNHSVIIHFQLRTLSYWWRSLSAR